MKANQSVKIGIKETRNLCEYHYNIFKNKEAKYEPNFSSALKLKEK